MKKQNISAKDTYALRKNAEEALSKTASNKKMPKTEADTLKLINELQVHQIELEMQNEELMAAKERAELAEEKYVDLYNFAHLGYLSLTKDGTITELNFAAAALLGKERLHLLNNRFNLFVSEATRAQFNRFFERLILGDVKGSCEVVLTTSNVPIYVSINGNVSQNGEMCQLTLVDITESKLAETRLISAKLHAEESDRLKTAFLQNMSHEIRTPMNAIMGFSSLLVDNFNNRAKLEMFSEIISQRCSDLLDIINDILDIAKIESGQLPVNEEECNLNELFGELTSFFKEQQNRLDKENINICFQSHLAPKANLIITDKVKLKQIFINLIGNALKFTDVGTIEVGCKMVNDKLLFYVSDTGIGIPAEMHKIVFERFAQLNPMDHKVVSGTGLGLAIVKGLVELLGGEIFLESEINKGSTFYFTLAYKTSELINQHSLVDVPAERCFSDKTILIVEDDFYNSKYLKEILSDPEFNIVWTKFGKEAVQIALSQPVDLVLMDIRLPDMDGYEATRLIKQQKPEVIIIAQTAYASTENRQAALDAGCDDYVSKPTKHELLLSIICKHLTAAF